MSKPYVTATVIQTKYKEISPNSAKYIIKTLGAQYCYNNFEKVSEILNGLLSLTCYFLTCYIHVL